jgi:glycosyltransferase involved in cell wall biosynthesis
MAKVSAVIPAYNAMKYLPEALEGVLSQTFSDFEVLIVNDGSNDNICEWSNQITDPRVQIISQENQGTSVARNTGILKSTGEYIAFLDADDIWEPSKLEKQVNYLDSHPLVGLVDTWAAVMEEDGTLTNKLISNSLEGDVFRTVVERCDSFVSCGSSPMVRRVCFDTLGLFDAESYVEDVDMWIRIGTRYQYGAIKEPLVRYRQHIDSKTRNCQLMLEGVRHLIEKMYSSMPTELLYLRGRSYCIWYLFLAWRALRNHDYKQAKEFRNQALAHYPQYIFSVDCLRLSIAISLLSLLGTKGYEHIRSLTSLLRKRILLRSN